MAQSSVTNLLADSRALREQGRLLRDQMRHKINALHNTMNLVHAGWTNILVFREAQALFNSLERSFLKTTEIAELEKIQNFRRNQNDRARPTSDRVSRRTGTERLALLLPLPRFSRQ